MSLHPHVSDAQYVNELERTIKALVDRLPEADQDCAWMSARNHVTVCDALLYVYERNPDGTIPDLCAVHGAVRCTGCAPKVAR